jgi:hypothetical protein
MSTLFSIGQMNQLGDALEAAQFTPDDVTRLRSSGKLLEIRDLIRGAVEIVVVKHIIDCDADPFMPEGWKVESHRKHGKLEWNPSNVRLHLSPNQQNNKVIQGNNLRKELENEPVLNANVADYLLAHPNLIPEEWKGKYVFFWGTIYRDSGGNLYIRYLCWNGNRWGWSDDWLGYDWLSDNPAACSQVSSN